MKKIQKSFIMLFLILLFFNEITISNEACDSDDNPSYKGDCVKLSNQVNEEKCCYIEYKVNGIKFKECTLLEKAEWENFGSKFNTLKKSYEEKNSKEFKLDCKSFYLKNLMICIVIIFFLF